MAQHEHRVEQATAEEAPPDAQASATLAHEPSSEPSSHDAGAAAAEADQDSNAPDPRGRDSRERDSDTTDDSDAQQEHEAGGNPAAERAGIDAVPDDEEIAEIEEERKRRLAPENRPDEAEIDNSDVELPTVEAWNEEHKDEGAGGTSDPSAAFRDNPPSEEEIAEMAEERERRLDPDNRPENAEVDNTHRTFEDGKFID